CGGGVWSWRVLGTWVRSHSLWIEHSRLRNTGTVQHQSAARAVDGHHATRLTGEVPRQNRLQRLHRRDDIAVRRQVVVSQRSRLLQSIPSSLSWTAKLHDRDFLEEAAQDLDAVAALRPLPPGLDEGRVVMVI